MPQRSRQVLVAEGLARQGQLQPAVEACYEALRIDEGEPFAHALLAELMLAGDFYERAVHEATLAIEVDPGCAPAYLALGLAYDRRGGMWDQSILVWHELAEVVPDLVTAHVQLGEALAASGFEEEAIESWRRALELDPAEPRAMYDLAVAALKREGMATALPGFRKAGELDPSADELFFWLSGVQENDEAAPSPSEVAPDRDSRLRAARELAYEEDLFFAMELVRAILGQGPDDAETLALAAYAYLKQEAVNEAVACALRALAIDAAERTALYCLGVAFSKRTGLNKHASRVFASLARAAEEHPLPHVLYAESLLGLQRYAAAKQAYRTAVALDPACVRARFGLAAVYVTEGRHAQAEWEIRRAAYYDTKRQGLFWRLYDDYAEGGS
ncbi:MAG: tetratricopeptide repeat protein [Coriobacteriia bacterium]|nr:tetratricopeptide repeat protein [Coriobacteriia bacterium]